MATSESEALAPQDTGPVALLISPAEADHGTLEKLFKQYRWNLHASRSLDSALAFLKENAVSIVITERDLAEGNWRDVLKLTEGLREPPLLIVISRLAENDLWAEALNLGAYDVLAKPLIPAEVVRVLTSAWIQQLTQQMNAAHRAYKEAAAHYNEIQAKYGDLLDSVDGAFALRRAAENERRASQRYRRAAEAYGAMVSSSRLSGPPRETES